MKRRYYIMKKLVKNFCLITLIFTMVLSMLSVSTVFAYNPITKTNEGIHIFEAVIDSSAEEKNTFFTFKDSNGSNADWPTLLYISGNGVRLADGNSTSKVIFSTNDSHHVMVVMTLAGTSGEDYPIYDLYVNGVKKLSSKLKNGKVKNSPFLYAVNGGYLDYSGVVTNVSETVESYSAKLESANEDVVLSGDFEDFKVSISGIYSKEALLNAMSAPKDATVTVECADENKVKKGDTVTVTSANGKVTNVYSIISDVPAVSSSSYTVSGAFEISGVYEFTSVSKFLSYLSADEGWTLKVINGDTEITNGVVSETMTLRAENSVGECQEYTIKIKERNSKTTNTSSSKLALPMSISAKGALDRCVVIELNSKVVNGYHIGTYKDESNYNNALWISSDADGVKLGLLKNKWAGENLTDLKLGDDMSVTFVIYPGTANDYNRISCFINGDLVADGQLSDIYNGSWNNIRIHAQTSASIFAVEDINLYYSSKNMNKLSCVDNKVSVAFTNNAADKIYLAIYSGNELESLQIADLADFNFSNNVLNLPENLDGKTVKAFLWTDDITPIDCLNIR